MSLSGPEPLTERQAVVFATISHYYEYIGEAASPSYIARKAGISRDRVYEHLRALHRKGWLKGDTLAIPIRRLPEHPPTLS